MSERIPVNIVTGFLGAGKTTTVQQLLAQKPAGERWAVLVNEFGRGGVDGALLRPGAEVWVETVSGGCACCDAALMFRVALHRLLRKARPHRLLIEPTGLGHAWRIAGILAEPEHRALLERRATLCVTGADQLLQPGAGEHPVFHEQLWLADRVLLNRADCVDADGLAAARAKLAGWGVAPQALVETRHGRVEAALLDAPVAAFRPPRQFAPAGGEDDAWRELPGGRPGVALWHGRRAGWQALSLDCSGDWQLGAGALDWLRQLAAVPRCKGLLAVDGQWLALNASGGQWRQQPLLPAERGRLELLWPDGDAPAAEVLAGELLARLAPAPRSARMAEMPE